MPKTSVDKYGDVFPGEIEIRRAFQLRTMYLPTFNPGPDKAGPQAGLGR